MINFTWKKTSKYFTKDRFFSPEWQCFSAVVSQKKMSGGYVLAETCLY